jgi:hypothetical protein
MATPIATMISEMHAKGIPVEFIIRAVETLEEAMAARAVSTVSPVDTSTIDKRRAWDRERKRRKRQSAMSTGSPPDSTGIPADECCIIREKKEEAIQEVVKEKKESKKNARGTRIPPDFQIDDSDRAFAASIGIPPDMTEAETPQFIDYWSGVPGVKGFKLDWKATWRNRMRDIKKYMPTSTGRSNGQRTTNSRTTGHDAILAAATREAGKIPRDDELAGAAPEAQFPFGDFSDRDRAGMDRRPPAVSASNHDRREPSSGRVFEGEIIAPDQASPRVSNGWRGH